MVMRDRTMQRLIKLGRDGLDHKFNSEVTITRWLCFIVLRTSD